MIKCRFFECNEDAHQHLDGCCREHAIMAEDITMRKNGYSYPYSEYGEIKVLLEKILGCIK